MTIRYAVLSGVLAFFSSLALGQDGMEKFAEVDPYTEGDRARMQSLGYVNYGPFLWSGSNLTSDVRETMGNPPTLWVETAHFRIGSTLGTYKLLADRPEKDKLKGEIARLKKKLGKMKVPKKVLDPWLRLHLYAQRAEDVYSAFIEDFGLEPAHYEEKGKYLGVDKKFQILLCQRKSELGRYIRVNYKMEPQSTFRWGSGHTDGIFFGANVEDIKRDWTGSFDVIPFDSLLHMRLVWGLAATFMDNYRRNSYSSPRWLSCALGHLYVRRLDARWIASSGIAGSISVDKNAWKWSPRVLNLVKNDFFASATDMFGWGKTEEMNTRDHMVSWSKLEYMIEVCKGDKAAFLNAVCAAAIADVEDRKQAQSEALQASFGMSPSEFDAAWAKWVKKVYKKR